jgi:hypothetical protein
VLAEPAPIIHHPDAANVSMTPEPEPLPDAPRVHPSLVRVSFVVTLLVIAVTVLLLRHIYLNSKWHLLGITADQVTHGQEIYYALRSYAEDEIMNRGGAFPTYLEDDPHKQLHTNSNEALQTLLSRYCDKRTFLHRRSAWCRSIPDDPAQREVLRPGENDWCYVRGLRVDSPPAWPILANAFAPGTTAYVKDPTLPGGVFRGNFALVYSVGGAAEIINTTRQGNLYVVPRKDKPAANAFEKDADWLTGKNVELLFPALPPPQ